MINSMIGRAYLTLCWVIAIFILTAYPMPYFNGDKFTYYDKVAHLLLYGILAYLILFLAENTGYYKKNKKLFFAFAAFCLSFSYAVFGEWIQSFVPGRDVSSYDLAAGAMGAILFIFLFYAIKRQ